MMKPELVTAALDQVRRAEDMIVSEMARNGIPEPHCIIHSSRDGVPVALAEIETARCLVACMQMRGVTITCTLYSSAKVFAVGIQRQRRNNRVLVGYDQVPEAIGAAERFLRGRPQ